MKKTICLIFLLTSCLTSNKVRQEVKLIPRIESKWYCFYVHDIELDMKYIDCYENDSTRFRKYHNEDRFRIIDTLGWGVTKSN